MFSTLRLSVLSIAALAGVSQTDRGVISGTVKDARGAVVPGALARSGTSRYPARRQQVSLMFYW
jgi:hypothetical protein